jgi:hypothetical protein
VLGTQDALARLLPGEKTPCVIQITDFSALPPVLNAALYSVAEMYARKLKVEIIVGGERRPCPLDWLDGFAMRNFTGSAEFDDTLPTGEGQLEAGFRVEPERLAEALSAWLTKRGKGDGQPVQVEIRPA